MRKVLFPVAVLGLLASGCAGMSFANRGVPFGTIYVSTETNERVTENSAKDLGSAGEACATSILGWVVTGEASVAEAMKDGKLKRVAVVDSKFTNILGVYAKYCVQVYGE